MIAKLKHFSPKETKNNKSLWHLIDATDKTLGRLASEISVILMGKNKVDYIPHQMSGDFVVIINSSNVKVTGKKLEQKTYITHSTRPGSTKEKKYSELLNNNPQYIISHAVKGMLPHNKLGRKLLKHLKVYRGDNHPHETQNPEKLTIN